MWHGSEDTSETLLNSAYSYLLEVLAGELDLCGVDFLVDFLIFCKFLLN